MAVSSRIADLSGFQIHREPALRFGDESPEATGTHPLRGLATHGPYSLGKVTALPKAIRVAAICPKGEIVRVQQLVRELTRPARPKERTTYLIDWKGFLPVFRVQIESAEAACWKQIGLARDAEISDVPAMRARLIDAFMRALSALEPNRSDFDVLCIYLPVAWQSITKGGEGDDFDLHHHLKAVTAAMGIPTQILNDGPSGAIEYFCRCSAMWRLAIALYAKAGGIPWVLASPQEGAAYIGIDYSIRYDDAGKPSFTVCCSQVFDADGSSLEFVAYETKDILSRDNPFLSREEMISVVSSSLSIYQRRHSGQSPKYVLLFKNTPFKSDEVDGCFDALSSVENVELIQINVSSGLVGAWYSEKGKADKFPCKRGLCVQIGGTEVLLWTNGNSDRIVGGRDFFKGGKGVPRPLLLKRFGGTGSMDPVADAVLSLSKMNWNNDGPYDHMPVVMSYAEGLADIAKRMPNSDTRPLPIRLFM